MNWALILFLVIVSLQAGVWIVYGFLKAFNGILYEVELMRRYRDDARA